MLMYGSREKESRSESPRKYFLQLGPICYIFHSHSIMNPSVDESVDEIRALTFQKLHLLLLWGPNI
jgi:hypothetical protein